MYGRQVKASPEAHPQLPMFGFPAYTPLSVQTLLDPPPQTRTFLQEVKTGVKVSYVRVQVFFRQ